MSSYLLKYRSSVGSNRDSITSGEGGSPVQEKEMTWNSLLANAVDNYAYMTAKELGARCTIASVRAAGAFSVPGKATGSGQSIYYEQVCSLLKWKETNNWVLWKNGISEVSI